MAASLKCACILLLVTLAVCVFAQGPPNQQCGPNEEFTSCGSACPPRCGEDPNVAKPCTMQCIIGCQCRTGLLLNSAGQCVPPNNC